MENDHQLNFKQSSGPGLNPTTSSIIKKDFACRISKKFGSRKMCKVVMIKFVV